MNKHKLEKLLLTLTLLIVLSLTITKYSNITLADDITSDNYKIIAPTLSTGDDVSNSTEYNLLDTMGELSADPRLFTSSYEVRPGVVEIIHANVPQITCFETDTDGSSSCDSPSTPQYVRDYGMVRVCGPNGCYDRGHFEIDPQDNPSDTLYGIQVSETSDFSTTYYIDSDTFTLIPATSRTIDDYKTESFWENELFNIRNLNGNTQYWIRATALHGDFTESQPGPSKSATTTFPILQFDISLADTTAVPPVPAANAISLTLPAGSIEKANLLIWMDSGTNWRNGMEISLRGLYGALYQNASTEITSSTLDLATAAQGFGLQHYQMGQDYNTASGNGDLSTIAVQDVYTQTYSSRTENIGDIPQSPSTSIIYDSSGPIYNGQTGTYVAGKSRTTTSPGNYTETITFTMITGY